MYTLYTIQCAKSEVAGPSVSLAEWGSINSAPALRLKSTGPMEWGNTVFVYSSNSLQSGRRLLMAVQVSEELVSPVWRISSGCYPVNPPPAAIS